MQLAVIAGGLVFRTDVNGEQVEIVAGGLRNAYDLAVNSAGEIFTHDSDMEWIYDLVTSHASLPCDSGSGDLAAQWLVKVAR